MANTSSSDKWYFTKDQLENTPSRKCGYDSFKELSYRQQAANFIQDMGQRLKVNQLCINTAIVYMHRFYVFHSFTQFPWHQISAAALFLAAKVEEQPRKLEYVIRAVHICRNPRDTSFDIHSERYLSQAQDLVFNENVLLQTLGFDVAIDHPHTHVVRCCHLVRASKDLAQTSYFMASNSLHLTTMCIQYKPTVVACFCIMVACKWSNWEIPLSNEKKEWYSYVDPTVTAELLQQLTEEFLVIFENCPSRLKEKIMAISENVTHSNPPQTNSPFDQDPKKITDSKDPNQHRSSHDSKDHDIHKHRSSRPHESSSSSNPQRDRDREYRERKERERLAHQHGQKHPSSIPGKPSHGHHKPPNIDPKLKPPSRPSGVSFNMPPGRQEPRDLLRETSKDSPFGVGNKDYRDHNREHGKDPVKELVRGDKEVKSQRDYLLKPNVTESNSLSNYPDNRLGYNSDKRVVDPNRSRVDANKYPPKHESSSRPSKSYAKTETDNAKKYLNAPPVHEKSSAYMNKSSNSTSQKMKSPLIVDSSKSVPMPNVSHTTVKSSHHNGSSSNGGSLPVFTDIKTKPEPEVKQEVIQPPQTIKRPSLFSPEKTPPHKSQPPIALKTSPDSVRRSMDTHTAPASQNALKVLSPLTSPVGKRNRNYSSSSEPELRPVMKKIDQVEGFENLMRDSTINKIPKVPDIPVEEKSDETVALGDGHADTQAPIGELVPLTNGIEINATMISNLLKEASQMSHLPPVSATNVPATSHAETVQPQSEVKEKDHHHHKSKKKNKEKHKHKDRSKEDKEKKKKHKDKDREKHKHKDKHVSEPVPEVANNEPIKIKIQKDKILPETPPVPSVGLKIKIPKDKIKTEDIGEPSKPLPQPPSTGALKIKIPKDIINNCNMEPSNNSSSGGKKRDRSSYSGEGAPPTKLSKSSYKDPKQNGRHSYSSKVTQMGDGDASLHKLADSKYISKGSS
ncbi:cyclin-T-like isoform X2 [Aethina tumida]|uniref:cyclin-T-like isoform X2 n=1 Tax=Aethina tumida TaxID=116153 RepID=UPI002148568E|nr:cyclin-T-like isoform X2 [Aethina tumida]